GNPPPSPPTAIPAIKKRELSLSQISPIQKFYFLQTLFHLQQSNLLIRAEMFPSLSGNPKD
ncbi:MAG: hypothetical protein ACRDB6_09165, partial [Cetobacterium sp.]